MDETLIEKIEQEKIVMPANQQDIGWNNAIDYILAEYGQLTSHSSGIAIEGLDDDFEHFAAAVRQGLWRSPQSA